MTADRPLHNACGCTRSRCVHVCKLRSDSPHFSAHFTDWHFPTTRAPQPAFYTCPCFACYTFVVLHFCTLTFLYNCLLCYLLLVTSTPTTGSYRIIEPMSVGNMINLRYTKSFYQLLSVLTVQPNIINCLNIQPTKSSKIC